jgi:hypothetical protein
MFPPEDDMMMDPGMAAAAPEYPGAFRAMNTAMDGYIGQIQLQDILGIGQEGDYLDVEQEFGGTPIPLSQLVAMEEGGGAPSIPDQGYMPDQGLSAPDPMESEPVRKDMEMLLADRAKSRQAASDRFQQKVVSMMKPQGGAGGGY